MSDKDQVNTEPDSKSVTVEEYNKVIERARKFEAMATDYEKRFKGVDVDALKAKAEEADILRRQGAVGDEKKVEELLERTKKEVHKNFSDQLTSLEQEREGLRKELKSLRVVNVAMQEAASVFNPDALPLIKGVIENYCDWDNDTIVVRGDDGKPRPSKADPRKGNMDVKEFLAELRERYPSCAKPMGKGGTREGGSTIGSIKTEGVTVEEYEKMSPAERLKLPPVVRGKLAFASLKH